ncbi:MAG: hypothetical protein U1E65_35180 [Myxococcota bacterium]
MSAAALLLGLALSSAEPPKLTGSLVAAAEAVLALDKKGLDSLNRIALEAPDDLEIQGVIGTAALVLGDRLAAERILGRVPSMAAYLAMAELMGQGGNARANTTLSRAASLPDKEASPTALFLASLAFYRAGQPERAHEILKRSLKLSESALDEAFSPDPAVPMVRGILRVAEREHAGAEAVSPLAMALFRAGRRGEAVRLAEKALADPETRAAGLRVLVLAENAAEARRALARAEKLLADDPKAEDAQVAKIVLLVRLRDYARAEKALEALGPVHDAELESDLMRAKAELMLSQKRDPAEALEAAEAAARANPKSDEAIATLVLALLAAKKVDRAEAFAGALYKRRPRAVDPFALLAVVAEAKGQKARAEQNRLRSKGFLGERARLEQAVEAREEVLKAVRDAEGGLGPHGLDALRGEYPTLSLTPDIALARSASPGFQAAARDRILAACAPMFPRFLSRNRGWDTVTIAVSLYGETENLDAFLSGPDPSRCEAPRANQPRKR